MLNLLFARLIEAEDRVREAANRIRREERGDGLVNWIVLAVGLAAAAAVVVALLKPAIQDAGQRMVDMISGSGG